MKLIFHGMITTVNLSNNMCGIYGSSSFEEFKTLYKLNISRGNFANSHLFINNRGDFEVEKRQGETDYDIFNHHGDYNMFTGHTQSPTGKVRDYRYDTSHPFQTTNWIVSHNGVLNNHKQLVDQYIKHHDCDVDSSVIPAFMEHLTRGKPIKRNIELMDNVVKATLDHLSGTYSVTIYNKPNNLLYIARCGSTLFYNPDGDTYSSVQSDNLEPVPECVLFRIYNKQFKKITNLKNVSSFIIF